jgi:formate-dependent nitrite reductase cytochrome c552 subunit
MPQLVGVRTMLSGREYYLAQLQMPEWKAKRSEIYERDGCTCVDCGKNGVRLHCHHDYYVKGKKPWEYPAYAFATLCDGCHDKRHKALSNIPHSTQEDADEWVLFSEVYAWMLETHLKEREKRIGKLRARGATWDSENQYFGMVDKYGNSRFYDADGELL